MACETTLPREFLKDKLGKKWLTHELYARQTANLLATEKARLGEDMEEALRVKAAEERLAEGKRLKKTWSNLQKRQTELLCMKLSDGGIRGLGPIRPEVANELLAIKQQINEITDKIESLEAENEAQMILANHVQKPFEYKIRCPKPDCVGFANELCRCTHCQTFICETCHEEASEGHVCDADTIKNVQLLQKDTKGCPNCSTPIHKIEGCDQMWCPQCKTAFSWNTGKIDKGIIHNPHYYRWQETREQAVRNVGDQACGGIPTRQTIINLAQVFGILLNDQPKIGKETKAKLLVLRAITLGHIVLLNTMQDDLDTHREEIQTREATLRNLRINLLTGKITSDEEYRNKHLNNFLHKQSYSLEAIPIYEMVTACVIERINEIIGLLTYDSLASLRTELAAKSRADIITFLCERLEKVHSEITSIYKYAAHELVKLTTYYPKKLKNRGQEIVNLFEELPSIGEECEKIVMDGYSDLYDAWTNPITDRFGQV
jgi:hypothetical protein